MKKLFTIFLSVVYLASFSGIFLGSDCNVHSSTATADGITEQVRLPNDQPASNNTHPLFQFCKAVEFHKEVLMTAKVKQLRPSHTLMVSSIVSTEFDPPLHSSLVSRQNDHEGNKIFILNRALLI